MTVNELHNLSGFLLEWASDRPIREDDLTRCSAIKFVKKVEKTEWEEFSFVSTVAFRGEDQAGLPGPFRYALFCRRSGSRIALMSINRIVVTHLLERHLHGCFRPPLRSVPIAVDQLVKKIASQPTEYALSFVHARVPAFGTCLRSVSFYGDDLAEASLFRDNISFMDFFTCGLRQAVGGPEIVRLGGDGTLSFVPTSVERLNEVEEVLRFLRKNGYLAAESVA